MAKLKIATNPSVTDVNYPQPNGDLYVSPTLISSNHFGGVGGDTGVTGNQIQGQSYINGASSQQCFIIGQKGAHKFRVQDANSVKGTCTLVNNPSPTAGQMNVLITLNSAAANIAAANVAGGASSATVTLDTRTAVTGPVSFPRVGDYIIWTSPSANIGSVVQVTGVTNTTSFTIGTVGNVAAVTGVALTTNTYAKRITNKFVSDFNNNKFRYHSATQTSTFVKIQSA